MQLAQMVTAKSLCDLLLDVGHHVEVVQDDARAIVLRHKTSKRRKSVIRLTPTMARNAIAYANPSVLAIVGRSHAAEGRSAAPVVDDRLPRVYVKQVFLLAS